MQMLATERVLNQAELIAGEIAKGEWAGVQSFVIGCYYGARNRRPGLAAGTPTPHRLSKPKYYYYLYIARVPCVTPNNNRVPLSSLRHFCKLSAALCSVQASAVPLPVCCRPSSL